MTQENNTIEEETTEESRDTPDFVQWSAFFWKLIKSLLIVGAGTTAIVYICRWLIY
ncbi:permeases of the major facilitator superfamily [Candidatus Scalindua japonica]|uniref:Permeases of the major facilitator superfamily n=1 Tax=Candidatus Scalindua japonica TaxID=1284222 RepID=A0A286TWN5_9BACT|nr:hypothetical protein [Candidatus Scalindua japonica]GAX60293.1 permeases of the major facilitator superfamily [Candidatus Scalindua japonica]